MCSTTRRLIYMITYVYLHNGSPWSCRPHFRYLLQPLLNSCRGSLKSRQDKSWSGCPVRPCFLQVQVLDCHALSVYLVYLILRRLIIWPFFLSPLRKLPGPPVGNLILGQSRTIINSETGIPQREWVKQYGPIVRIVGPVGVERLMFMKPEALHQILVKDWLQYPRVSLFFHHAIRELMHIIVARIYPQYSWNSDRIWTVDRHRGRA